MTRAFDFTVVTVVLIISIVVHMIGLELFVPGTPLYELATDGTATMNGQARADLWSQALTIWVPMLSAGGIMAWGFIREYRRQVVTAAQGAPRP